MNFYYYFIYLLYPFYIPSPLRNMNPLALSSKSERSSFGIEDDTLDFFEYYNLSYNPNFLMVHDATKIFTYLYKDNREIHPFGMVYSHRWVTHILDLPFYANKYFL